MMDNTVDGEHEISVNSISPLSVTIEALTTHENLQEIMTLDCHGSVEMQEPFHERYHQNLHDIKSHN